MHAGRLGGGLTRPRLGFDEWLVMAVVLALFFEQPDFSLWQEHGFPIPNPTFVLVGAVVIGRAAFLALRGRFDLSKPSWREFTVIGLIAAYAVTSVLAALLGHAAQPPGKPLVLVSHLGQSIKTFAHFAFLGLMSLVLGRLLTPALLRRAFATFFVLAVAAAVIACLQAIDLNVLHTGASDALHLVWRDSFAGYLRPCSVFSEPAIFGYYMLFGAVVGLWLDAVSPSRWIWLGIGLCVVAILLGTAAGPVAVFFVGFVYLLWRAWRQLRRSWRELAMIAAAAAALLAVVPIGPTLSTRATGAVNAVGGNNGSNSGGSNSGGSNSGGSNSGGSNSGGSNSGGSNSGGSNSGGSNSGGSNSGGSNSGGSNSGGSDPVRAAAMAGEEAQFRLEFDKASLKTWELAPLTGVGLGNTRYYNPLLVHLPYRTDNLQFQNVNGYLGTLAESGVFGFLLLATMMLALFLPLPRVRREGAWVTETPVLLFIAAFFIVNLFAYPIFWFWVAARLAHVRQLEGARETAREHATLSELRTA